MTDKPVYVTRPSLPPLDELYPLLEEIWQRGILTNSGPLHVQLEEALCEYLEVPYISLYSNGTTALLAALAVLDLPEGGEVITTPFTFIATANALIWNRLTPVFVDIDPTTFNISPEQVEAAITDKTRAILGVHVFGTPCDVDALDTIAIRHGLKVVYDAAHAFGVKCHCGSLLQHGDLSALSFHATKVFNTFEGGAVVCHSQDMKEKLDAFKNFGLTNAETANHPGLNAKLSEFNAAIGLLQLKYVDQHIEQRRRVAAAYHEELETIPGIELPNQKTLDVQRANHSYFAIRVTDEFPISRDALLESLQGEALYARRYFFPLVSQFKSVHKESRIETQGLKAATRIAHEILCLPIYPDMDLTIVQRMSRCIVRASKIAS